jgi:glycosyltransferase involved in cell wall biosynthesis
VASAGDDELMRILFQIRPSHEEHAGGDTLHATRTVEELEKLGVEVEVSGSLAPDLAGYDLVHLFNTELIEPTFRHCLRARAAGVPIVLTPIFWRAPLEDLRFDEVDRVNLRRRDAVMRDVAFGLVDALLPNSRAELDGIAAQFSPLPSRIEVVPVGVDAEYERGDGERFCARYDLPLRGFVLCAARLEERKNQLRLIEACAPLGMPLVLAGAEYEDRAPYASACHEAAKRVGADVRFLGQISPEGMADAYAAARVHALPSIWETVGLASLEAAMAGCNVVSTDRCGVGEYLGDGAWYCDPESVESIRAAVASALDVAPDGRAQEPAAAFTWARAAASTRAVYEAVLSEVGTRDGDWRAALSPEQYIEHLEALIQLQLETIALRDGHYANARDRAEKAVEYAQSLEAERARLEAEVARLSAERSRARKRFGRR